MDKLLMVEQELLKGVQRDYPDFKPGDVIKVHYRIKEKDKERIHPIEGLVIKVQGEMQRKSFTVRRIAYGEAYEISIPYYSPRIKSIELIKASRRQPRRSRLYYLRKRVGKEASLT